MSRLRTFIAVAVDRAIRGRLVSLQAALARSAEGVKWVEEENLHVTLLFLGDVDERDVTEVCRTVAKVCAAHEPFLLRVEGVGCFPQAKRPRTIWAGISSGTKELIALHAALEPALSELGCYRHEERQYTPHLTLGRVKHSDNGQALVSALQRHTDWVGGECEVAEILVMSSQLTPRGPIYGVLSTAELG